ncbi:lipopolysaccharide biosynthesis protein [Cupriavidus basilensis]|uniref:lipopolysaccharide biosynthesis protein n=1 Tax=Cupriavidus basilensis TaxID=68895 RepID=UPI0020A688C0|nr:oligosaccharide flippase family protein [Cupriavidus basilensis]
MEDLKKLKGSAFFRSVIILAGGTALSQIIMVLALPILTRIYTPDHFGVLAVYVAALNICSVVACLRFDIAIPIANLDEDAANLLGLSLLSTIVTSSLFLAIVLSFPTFVVSMLGKTELKSNLWLLPAGVALAGSYSALQNWNTRKKNFSAVSRTRMTQSIAGATTQIGCGSLGYVPLGLLLGQMLSVGAGVFGLGYRFLKKEPGGVGSVSWRSMWSTCRKYKKFPKYSTLEALTNSAAIQVPLIMIAASAVGPEAGYLMLAMRIIQAPMSLIGNAISQVYISEAHENYAGGKFDRFTENILEGLFKTGVGPLILFGAIAPKTFEFVFGNGWGRAGWLVMWMTPWFIMQFLVSPISMALHVTKSQRLALALQMLGFLSRVGMVAAAIYLFGGFVSEMYAISGFIFYVIYFAVILHVSSISMAGVMRIIKSTYRALIGWIFVSLVAFYSIRFGFS